MKSKKKFIFIFVSFFILNLIYLINIYIDIKEANVIFPLSIEINTQNNENGIKVKRISISGFEGELFKDEKTNIYYSFKGEYFRNIKIILPANIKINFIIVNIGNREFITRGNKIEEYWDKKNDNNVYILTSNKKLSCKRSIFPKINKIINWTGDFNFFVGRYIFYILFFIFLIFLIRYVIIKLKVESLDYFIKDEKRLFLYKSIYFSILAFIIFFALLQRFTINSVPYDGNDTGGYIRLAVKYFNNEEMINSANRGYPYLLFILFVLFFFKDFAYISIIQHLLGIFSGLIILYVFNDISKNYLINKKKNKIFFDFLGLFLLVLYLFNQSIIVYEHSIRPEGIYSLFLSLIILLLYKIFINIKSDSLINYIYCNLFFILNFFIYVLQPRWGLTVVLNILVYFIIIFSIRKVYLIRRIILLLILPGFLSFIFVYIPDKIFSKKEISGNFLAGKLFFSHPKIIDRVLLENINDPDFKKYDKDILKKLMNYHQIEYNTKQYKHKYLGFDHNNLFYGPANKLLVNTFTRNQYNKFCFYYFVEAIKKYPHLYIKKVLLELSQFYNFSGGMYPSRKFKVDYIAYDHEDGYEPDIKYLEYRSYSNILSKLKCSYYDFDEIKFPGIEAFYFILGKLYLVTFLLFFIFFGIRLFNYLKSRNYSHDLLLGLIITVLFFYNFCISLTNAAVYCLDVTRYIDDQYLIVIFSHLLAIIYLVLFVFLKNKYNFNQK